MRYARSQILPDAPATVHMYWRSHNREFLLQGDGAKREYVDSLDFGRWIRKAVDVPEALSVKIHAFGIMDNHTHASLSYDHLDDLSRFMQQAHGRFGARLNKKLRRLGSVGNERPRTSLVQNERHAIQVHFYIEANPVRAGLCKPENLKHYKWSSYRFYAYGVVDEQTKILTPPAWYVALGSTAEQRQSRYRSLFMDYIRCTEKDRRTVSHSMKRYFIGDPEWQRNQLRALNGGDSFVPRSYGQGPPS